MSRTTIGRLLCLVVAASSLAGAQDLKVPDAPEILHVAPEPSDRFPAKWYLRVGDGTDVLPAPVVDKPYTAMLETYYSYKSASGESLRHVTHDLQARDRFGRIRLDNQTGAMTVDGQMVSTKRVMVVDPVSHCQFDWMELTTGAAIPPEMRFANVSCEPQTIRFKDFGLFESILDTARDGTEIHGDTTTQTEHLAPLQTDGITIGRLRVTNESRNEQGQVKKWSTETWYSPDLKEVIRLGNEESGTILKDIRRVDPDPKLFYPPHGYNIEKQPDEPRATP